MTTLLNIADWIFIFVLGLPVLYLFVFALFSTRKNMDDYPQAKRRRKFVTLIPAYKSDAVIVRTAQAALRQEYPAQLHEVVVIADRLKPETLAELRTLPIRVLEVSFENSSKAKALNFAVEELGSEAAEAVTILDADNLAGEDFIARLNDVFDSGVQAVQAHRTAKNRDTDTAVLDAASEEINNAIFRRGHVALGLSSALIGSGMAFEYKWFRDNIARCTTSGEDKELEALLLRQGIYIDYIDSLRVLDEKVQGEGAYYNQRRRWIAAQFYALGSAVRQLPGAIAAGNLDYCDKLLQWCLPPRILLMGLVPLWTIAMTVFDPLGSIKWWIVLLLLLFALALALPDEQTDRQLGRALRRMPVLFLLTAANLFRLRGTKDKFIHTEHTGAGGNAPGANTPTEP
ncbi:MAG: glycosyltransferase family 2 protein [Alistipes finegoldii]